MCPALFGIQGFAAKLILLEHRVLQLRPGKQRTNSLDGTWCCSTDIVLVKVFLRVAHEIYQLEPRKHSTTPR